MMWSICLWYAEYAAVFRVYLSALEAVQHILEGVRWILTSPGRVLQRADGEEYTGDNQQALLRRSWG